MTSGKKARRKRQTVAPPPVRSTEGRTASPKVLAIAAAVVAVVAVAAVGAFALANRSSSSSTKTATVSTLPDAEQLIASFKGIPQSGNVLGSPKAPVTLVTYIDLQCPICRQFETEVMPTIISRYVRNGKVKVVSKPIAILGSESEVGRRAALAAGLQNRLSEFNQLLYANQGAENSGWLNNDLISAAYASIPGFDAAAALGSRSSSSVLAQAGAIDKQATADRVIGTPTVLVGKTGGQLTDVSPGGAPDVAALSAAIKRAQR